MDSKRQIAIFENARAVIRAEQACRDNELIISVVPMPEHYSSECGMSLVFETSQRHKFDSIITQLSLEVKIHNYE